MIIIIIYSCTEASPLPTSSDGAPERPLSATMTSCAVESDCPAAPPSGGTAGRPLLAHKKGTGRTAKKPAVGGCPAVSPRGGAVGQPLFAHKKGTSLKGKKSDDILVAHLNVRSLTSKVDELHSIVSNLKIDILCVSETWLDPSIGKQSVHIPGFHFYRKDRKQPKSDGEEKSGGWGGDLCS